MRNYLIDQLHPAGAATDYKYRLNVSIREADINLGIQQNTTSTRGQVRLTVDYYLVDEASGQTLLKETLRTSVGYDILLNQFSSVLSEEDAREQGLQQLAGDLTEHLALYFSTQK
jgi:LPS-assembly lipoprotein